MHYTILYNNSENYLNDGIYKIVIWIILKHFDCKISNDELYRYIVLIVQEKQFKDFIRNGGIFVL